MSRKSIVICICAVVILLGLIGFGVSTLYNGKPSDNQMEDSSHVGVLKAVPSDAAAVFCFNNAKDGVDLFADASRCFGTLLSGNRSFRSFVDSLAMSDGMKQFPMAVSLHFARVLEPLMVLDCGHHVADTTEFQRKMLAYAASCGLQADIAASDETSYLIISGSETVTDASLRHVEGGVSLLDDTGFETIAGRMPYRNVLFISNDYSSKLIAPFFKSEYQKSGRFLKTAADWTAFSIDEHSAKHLQMSGQVSYGHSPSYYFRLVDDQPAGDLRFPEIAPAGTTFAFSLAVPDQGNWNKSYMAYLDASTKLQKYQRDCDTLFVRSGIDPIKWAASSNVREVALVRWKSADGKAYSADFVRQTKMSGDRDEIISDVWSGFPAVLWGDLFSIEDDSYAACHGDWLVMGSYDAISDILANEATLKDRIDGYSQDIIPAKNAHFAAYFSGCDARSDFNAIFRSGLAEDMTSAISSSVWAPMVLAYDKSGLMFNSVRMMDAALVKAAKSKGNDRDSRAVKVEVPSGPFKVTNCATGKTNLFYQNDNLSLCLKDEATGKGLWGVPFDAPICGKVECIDYLANGKLQFLFAAGSRLYLIDRLGRFVSGFPVDLCKDVLIGPAAYDFSGAKGYTVMALHKDNTIEMYDIHGYKPAQWQGISSESTILDLPSLAYAEDDRKCWVVHTAAGDAIYDFWGGAPLKKKEIRNLRY